MKFTKLLFFCFLSILFSFYGYSQDITIKGKVYGEIGQPLSGVSIQIKGTSKGVTTDFDGSYQIKSPSKGILEYSSVGYNRSQETVEGRTTIDVKLKPESQDLKEVVVVGYGTQKKKYITSAISTVKSESFDDRPLYSVGQAIQGNAAGVNVVQPSGKPGVGLDIRIRGLSSINSGNNPIYIIDGIQTYSTEGISTDDIVDINILKDATSTAIYGVNGSAGVVIITTKRGKANKSQFNFNAYLGTSKIVKNLEVLNLDQYKTLMADLGPTGAQYLLNANNSLYKDINTNWVDKVFQKGQDQNYDFSFTGGTDKIKAFASLGYLDSRGIVRPSNFERISGRVNLDLDATRWLKAHVNMNLIHTNLNNTADNNSANQGGVILSALTTPAFLPVYADQLIGRVVDPATNEYTDGQKDGQFAANPTASLENPVAFQSRQDDTKINRYMGNISFDVTLLKNLVWKPSSTIDVSKNINDFFVDSYRSNYGRGTSTSVAKDKGIAHEITTTNQNLNIENTLNYSLKSGNHDLNLLVGVALQKERYDQLRIFGTGFATNLRKLDLSQMIFTDPKQSDTIASEKNYASYFGRATYNYNGKYIINGVFRASGASQLALGHKWGYFPGVSAAWVISNENFLKDVTSISDLKLRGGWGQTGNISAVSPYSSFGTLRDDHGTLQHYFNIDLTWETTSDLNIGLDIGIISNRVKLTIDAFQKTTNNLFKDITINGIPYYYNRGKLENKGLEFSLNTINFKGDFNWNTNFNISFIKNKVLEMGYQPFENYGYQGVNKIEKGVSLGNFYGYVVDRVNPANGILEYKDLNGDNNITEADKKIIGNALPKFTFGMTNTFSYKGFSLDVLVTGSQGNDIFNASRIDLEGLKDSKNQSVSVLNRWTTVGQITNIPKAASNLTALISPTAVSDRWVEDGSYIRLKATTLGYSFKKVFLGLKSLKLYATGQNLFTWTKYSGFDPEVSAYGGNTGTAQGIDYGTYPQVRTLIVGLKAGF